MVPEAPLERTEGGLVPAGQGWFVVNAREARWKEHESFGFWTPFEGDARFKEVGVNIGVLEPGQPSCMYHAEDVEENFLVLSGKCLLLVEGEERELRAWDFVHCPPWTEHVFVGAGDGPCVLLGAGSRQFQATGPWGAYTVDDAARRHDACPEEETQDTAIAYARFPPSQPTRYRDGWLPDY
jgi:uncharacterized cupin superfamily protein